MLLFILQNLTSRSPCKSPALHTHVTRCSGGRKPRCHQPAVLQWPENFCVKSLTLLSHLVKCIVMLLHNCSLVSISSRSKYFHNCVSKNQDWHQYIAFRLQQENTQLSLCSSRYHFHFRHGYTPARAEVFLFCSESSPGSGKLCKISKKRGLSHICIWYLFF